MKDFCLIITCLFILFAIFVNYRKFTKLPEQEEPAIDPNKAKRRASFKAATKPRL